MLIQGLAIAHALVVIVFSIRILLRDDLSSAARLAWFMFMLFVPYVGVVLYLLFGEISIGRTVHQRHDEIFAKLRSMAAGALGSCDRNLEGNVETKYQTAFRAASVDGFETTLGNKAELLPDAATARSRLIEDIDNAAESVQCLYYIWLDDNTGRNVAEALVRAARRGVDVYAMADGLGSRKFVRSKYWRKMRDAGVKLSVALPIKWVVDTILFSRLDSQPPKDYGDRQLYHLVRKSELCRCRVFGKGEIRSMGRHHVAAERASCRAESTAVRIGLVAQ